VEEERIVMLYCSYSTQRRDTLESILERQRRREISPIHRERSWLERTFNPTQEEMRDNLRSHMNNPVDRFIRENPLSLMGPGGSLVAQGAKVAGTQAVQKVAPK
jgi:hypothetical protein